MSGVPTAAKASAAATAATAAPAGHVAVVDIGSNSVRLVVYDRLARAPVPRFNEKFLCGLGSGLDGSGRLAPKAVACALQALGRFARIARAMEVVRLEAVATEAVRRAVDGAEFLALAERRLRAPIRVLEGSEEARLSALGVAGGFWRTEGVAGDIGGGSLELAEVGPEGARGALASLPLGALRLRQVLVEGRAAAERFIDEALDGVPWLEGAASRGAFYVVGGGWRALARIHLAVVKAPLRIAHGCTVSPEGALKLGREIAGMERKRLARLAGVPRRRVDTLPPSALLFERVILRLRPRQVVFSALGLREGLLFQALPPERWREDPLLAGARAFGRERNRAPAIGAAMAAWTAPLFAGESEALARLRAAAAEVSDTGWLESPASRAREAFFLLLHYPFIGIGHAERAWLAYAVFVRYEGQARDPVVQPLLALLDEAERRQAEILGLALQLGYRLSGGVPGLLDGTRLGLGDDVLRLHLDSAETAPEAVSLKPRLKALGRALGRKRTRIVIGGRNRA